MKPKVVVYKRMSEKVLDYIRESCEVHYFPGYKEEYEAFLAALKEAEGVLGSGLKFDEVLLDQAPKLKVICNTSVGYDNLNIPLLKERGILASNTPGVLNDTVADTIMALMLAAARRITELDQFVKTGGWSENGFSQQQFGIDVHHKTLGIIGMGGIGATLAKRAHFGFDMNILYHNRSRNKAAETAYHAAYCTMDELLAKSDFVCVLTPLTSQTEKLIGKREFEKMKQTAVFVNAARGKVVDEKALIEALQANEVLAAGLDVFEKEPTDRSNPLLKMPNVVTLPHIGSATAETRMKMAQLGAENLTAGVHGKKLLTPIY
ncbi:bifunctional glyoxylate/hydroxypyruvate reductase B [Domibacillus antri]|uniref:Glyoxylate/hydroxypyruvate reductase B n=1 Tax=Domibacillus antri TaxID=1714264 RepID=A0A1Q8Q6U0_9BACI|nr:D-glycerate dehydrogenase [Domibacillus antri]OLN23049.1 bifunctional glyoxylate/hydroxypyruvate reductase B [Domibacillus antri]